MHLVFGGECYYSSGGGFDLLHATDNKKDAIEFAKDSIGNRAVYLDEYNEECFVDIKWSHILCASTGKITHNFGDMPYGTKTQFKNFN